MTDQSVTHPNPSIALPDSLEWRDGASQLSEDLKVYVDDYGLFDICTNEEWEAIAGKRRENEKRKLIEDEETKTEMIYVPPESPVLPQSNVIEFDCFPNVPRKFRNRFVVGQKMEGLDMKQLDMNDSWWSVSVAEVKGHRVRLHFDGFSAGYDYWANAYSPLLRPCGFCARTQHFMQPPRGFDVETFQWSAYLAMTKCKAAPEDAFYDWRAHIRRFLADHSPSKSRLEVGTLLEAQLPTEPQISWFVAEIGDAIDDWFMLVLPYGANEPAESSFWTTADSPFVRAISGIEGSQLDGKRLMPGKCLRARAPLPWRNGQKIEVVHPRDHSKIAEAIVKDFKNNRILLEIQELEDFESMNMWFPEDSQNLFPLGFSKKMAFYNNPSEAELAKQAVEDEFDSEPKKKRKRRRFMLTMPSRPSRKTDAVEAPISFEDSTSPLKSKDFEERTKKISIGSAIFLLDSEEVSPCCSGVISPILYDIPENVYEWSVDEVANLIKKIPGCSEEHAELFRREEIDGEALLLMTQSDCREFLHLKLGPWLKIYHIVLWYRQLLKENCKNSESTKSGNGSESSDDAEFQETQKFQETQNAFQKIQKF